jgi:ABC-type sugar transport system substrate-binding protein
MVYATLRHQGINEVLTEENITTELLDCTHERSEIVSRISSYLIGHPETKGIIGVGALVTADGGKVVKDLDLKGKVYVGGFDLNPDTLKWIQEGYIEATIDAQPFLIGYLAVEQFYFHEWAGFSFMDIDTGTGLVDQSNVEEVLEFPVEFVR